MRNQSFPHTYINLVNETIRRNNLTELHQECWWKNWDSQNCSHLISSAAINWENWSWNLTTHRPKTNWLWLWTGSTKMVNFKVILPLAITIQFGTIYVLRRKVAIEFWAFLLVNTMFKLGMCRSSCPSLFSLSLLLKWKLIIWLTIRLFPLSMAAILENLMCWGSWSWRLIPRISDLSRGQDPILNSVWVRSNKCFCSKRKVLTTTNKVYRNWLTPYSWKAIMRNGYLSWWEALHKRATTTTTLFSLCLLNKSSNQKLLKPLRQRWWEVCSLLKTKKLISF